MSKPKLEELLAGRDRGQLLEVLLRLPPDVQARVANDIEGNGGAYSTQALQYPARSGEFSDLLSKVVSFMKSYQTKLTRGGAPQTPEVLEHLLIDGYRWEDGSVGIALRESSGFHGGDIITVRKQVLVDSSDADKPKSLGILSYEGGNGKLHAYAIFSLNGNSMYKDTTDDYELPPEMSSAETQENKAPINLQMFLSEIYSHRNTLTLKEISPKVSLTSHLTRRKNAISPR